MPFLRKIFEGRDDVSLVPVLVGDMPATEFAEYAALLAPFLADPACLFVVSSDFCHWGSRFGYQYVHPACKRRAIHEAIEHLDREVSSLQAFACLLRIPFLPTRANTKRDAGIDRR